MSKITISYGSRFDNEGTHYTQLIKIKCTRSEFEHNNFLMDVNKHRYHSFRLYGNRLHEGLNYTNVTTCEFFSDVYGFKTNKRYKRNRNTIIDISVI